MRPLLFLLAAATAFAQTLSPGFVDPRPVLEAASRAIGAGKLTCITFSGTGYAGKVGQNITQDTDWPRDEPLADYSRAINYQTRTSVERFTRKPGLNPRSWKYGTGWTGGTPLQQHPRQTFAVSGNLAWHIDGDNSPAVPAPDSAALWQLDIWLNPHGFLKAAKEPGANPRAIWRWEMGESGRDGASTGGIEKATIVSITVMGKYRVNATINSRNLIQRIQTWVPHPVLGDMNYEHEYTEWQTVDGITFPAGWHHHDGWDDERQVPTITGGHNGFGGSFPKIQPGACPEAAVPETVKSAASAASTVESQLLAPGVWLLGGASHNSVLVEFKDYLAVVEAPLDEQRSLAVIEHIVRLVPNKPIRFIVNTHAHYDHLGGLRTYLHIGATVVTHQRNRLFYEAELLTYAVRALQPDMMALFPPTEISEGYTIEDVDEKYVLSDGVRNLDLYYVQGLSSHAEGMLMAYLPKEKLLIEADLYDNAPGTRPDAPTAVHRAFGDNVRQLRLDVERIVPIHGRPAPWSEFAAFAGQGR